MSTSVYEVGAPAPDKAPIVDQLVEKYGREKAMELLALNAGYERMPVDIDTFIESDEYLGQALDNGRLVFPGWRTFFRVLFPDALSTSYDLVILSGAIGQGKSTATRIIFAYTLHRFLCLKNPHKFYGHTPTTKYTWFAWSPVMGTAGTIIVDELNQMLKDSPFFARIRAKHQGWYPHNICIEYGSTHAASVGRALTTVVQSEANFERIHGQSIKAFNSMIRRVQSRFQKNGRVPFPFVIDTSISDDQSFSAQVMKDFGDSGKVLYHAKSIWEIRPRSNYAAGEFKVFAGNDIIDPMILEPEDDPTVRTILQDPELNSRIVSVPEDFRLQFQADIIVALHDIAGFDTAGASGFLSSPASLKLATVTPNPITQTVIRLGLAQKFRLTSISDFIAPIYWANFPQTSGIEDYEEGVDIYGGEMIYQSNRLARMNLAQRGHVGSNAVRGQNQHTFGNDRRPRAIHVDLGLKKDLTGIACSYIDGYNTIERFDPRTGKMQQYTEPMYVTEWVIYIGAAPSDEVPIYKIRELMVDLRVRGVNIWKITMDGYQSAQILQELTLAGFNAELNSVDRTKEPYLAWKRALLEGRWQGPDSQRLRDEFLCLVDDGRKIDHSVSGSGLDAKDGADAVVGSLYSLFNNLHEAEISSGSEDELHALSELADGDDIIHDEHDFGRMLEDMLTR